MLLPEPEGPTRAIDSLGFISRFSPHKIIFYRDGYLNSTFLKTIYPSLIKNFSFSYSIDCLGSIFEASWIIEKILRADILALLIEGIYETATPAPIAPTNII